MKATIFHNPMCGTSRKTLDILRDSGCAVSIHEYLKDPPAREELARLYERAWISPREGLRAKEPLAAELGLNRPDVTDDEVLDAMIAHPILIGARSGSLPCLDDGRRPRRDRRQDANPFDDPCSAVSAAPAISDPVISGANHPAASSPAAAAPGRISVDSAGREVRRRSPAAPTRQPARSSRTARSCAASAARSPGGRR